MKKFLVLFLTPIAVIDTWMETDAVERKNMEDKMGAEWNEWAEKHKASIVEAPAGAGKTKRVSKDGVTDTRNDIMMYGIFQAASHEEAAALFVGHPHFGIPEATIEVMTITPVEEMGQ
jgi:hypothetical protein